MDFAIAAVLILATGLAGKRGINIKYAFHQRQSSCAYLKHTLAQVEHLSEHAGSCCRNFLNEGEQAKKLGFRPE